MKRLTGFILLMIALLFGCSSNQSESADSASMEAGTEESAAVSDGERVAQGEDQSAENQNNANGDTAAGETTERMVMYNAALTMAVADVEEAISLIEDKTTQMKGYIVQSSTYEQDEKIYGSLSVRIPSEQLHTFMDEIGTISEKVIQKSIEGQDVTEEYVDLESRLRAKQAVESRLLDLLNQAETTEDLLKISEDLGQVQAEIEQIEGRKQYLENRTEFAQVSLNIEDASVHVPEITKGEELQTGSKMKQAFMNSINLIVSFFSGVLVFLIGYSPLLILIAIPCIVIWLIIRKKNNSNSHEA
ncbi:DUF4349 domain-containing protein [Bacillus litorisediminis]|uniref:DUF4349 domain-containing protein n=1 Tax=Bacillus litorisediminis TaxID=2922713 RepID=UPI001FAFB32D|nr:DUF4349 domain-containing protein [Bacillus litorisediminis]